MDEEGGFDYSHGGGFDDDFVMETPGGGSKVGVGGGVEEVPFMPVCTALHTALPDYNNLMRLSVMVSCRPFQLLLDSVSRFFTLSDRPLRPEM